MRTALVMLLQFLFVVFQLWPAETLSYNCTRCGNITVPYPFGVADVPNCPNKPRFPLTCDDTFDPPRLRMRGGSEVINVSYEGQITLLSPVTFDCFNKQGQRTERNRTGWRGGALLTVSDTHNKFTTLGCDTISNLTGLGGRNIQSGCSMFCVKQSDVIDGVCAGIGCCQTSIPWGFGRFNVSLRTFENHTQVYDFNPCSYAFIAQSSWFNFSRSYLTNFTTPYPRNNSYFVPVVWDWAVSTTNCSDAQKDKDNYACRGDKNISKCVRSKNGVGYSCICSDGYQGNPYLDEEIGGCTDVNECKGFNNCSESGICKNKIGSYSCRCPWGYKGNGWKKNTTMYGINIMQGHPGCKDYVIRTIGAVGATTIVLPILIWFLYWAKRERQRMKCFQENGGKLLKRKINSHEDVKANFEFFRYAQLKIATDNFNEREKLPLQNDPDFCELFRGSQTNSKSRGSSQKKAYTVKRYIGMNKDQKIQFVNEVDALSQIDHPHVVKLLGCCLDTEHPMLVYEFIEGGTTLSQYCIEHSGNLSWDEERKRIAAQMTDALCHLVSGPKPPIFPGNFQSSNVLIEKNEASELVVKVCDFEALGLVPLYRAQYLQAQIKKKHENRKDEVEWTEKGVVYSFGLVLWELLTGKKEPVNLDSYSEDIPEDAKKVVDAIKSCLREKSENRPTMKEIQTMLFPVAGELGQGVPSSTSSSTTA